MSDPRLVLTGMGPKLSGLTWETTNALRIGRHATADLVLQDHSVERVHAEIQHQGLRWLLRDLAHNPLYPTFVNDVAVSGKVQVLQRDDIIRIGKLQLRVTELSADEPDLKHTPLPIALHNNKEDTQNLNLRTSGAHMLIKAKAQKSWDKALEVVSLGTPGIQDLATFALVRANHHLTHISHLEDLLRSILQDTIGALGAKRGSIILADPNTCELTCKATVTASPDIGMPTRPFSKTLVKRCFEQGESILCDDVSADESLAVARSIRSGAMASVICALLRTPRKRIGILHLDRSFIDDSFNENDLYYADAIAASVAVGIETAQLVEQQREQFIQTVTTLARAVEVRDQYTGDHTRRVTEFSLLLAEELKLTSHEKYQIQIGTPLHDIGKIGIDDAILRKPGKLTDGEFEAMKEHTTKGASLLDSMMHLGPMIPIVKHHHERWDGSGYPDRLHHEQIPLIARIVSVADAFDAMTSNRPYRPAMPVDRAFLELIGKAGTHFDPNCVFAFMKMRKKIEERLKEA